MILANGKLGSHEKFLKFNSVTAKINKVSIHLLHLDVSIEHYLSSYEDLKDSSYCELLIFNLTLSVQRCLVIEWFVSSI